MNYEEQLADWSAFYRQELDLEVKLPTHIPQQMGGFERLLVISDRVSHTRLIRAMAERFGLLSYYEAKQLDVDQCVRSERTGTYAVWVRDETDSDPELAQQSADDVAHKPFVAITLRERLVFELRRFVQTGRHLDVATTTLCAGSRNLDGTVPWVQWQPALARVCVQWGAPNLRAKELRIRQVIA